jgi:hypothetical protein
VLGGSSVALPAPTTITYPAGVVLTLERAPDVDLVYLVATNTAGTNTDAWVFTASLLFSDTVSVNSTNCTNATIAVHTGNSVEVYMEFENTTDPHLSFIERAVLSFDGTTLSVSTASSSFKKTVGLASKAFITDGVSYVMTQHESALQ